MDLLTKFLRLMFGTSFNIFQLFEDIMIFTARSMRPGQSTSPHLVITNASPCGPSGISSRAEAQNMSQWRRNLRFEMWMRLECIEHTATPTDVVLCFLDALRWLVLRFRLCWPCWLWQRNLSWFLALPKPQIAIPILMFDSVILSEIFHLEQKKNHHVRCS